MKQPTENHRWYIYRYIDVRPLRESRVIYIGKGTMNDGDSYLKRMRSHWQQGTHQNQLFDRVMKKIRALGLKPVMEVVSWHDSETDALDAEMGNIFIYKRRRDGGTLCNLTIGGEGASGYTHSPEDLELIRAASKAKWEIPEYRRRREESRRRYIEQNQESISARAAKVSAMWTAEKKYAHGLLVAERGESYREKIRITMMDPDRRAFSVKNAATALQDPDVIARRKVTLKATMADPEFREKMSKRVKDSLATLEAKANQRAASKKMWENPVYRETMAKARSGGVSDETRKKISERSKASIAQFSPETKAWLSAFRSNMQKERHARDKRLKINSLDLGPIEDICI